MPWLRQLFGVKKMPFDGILERVPELSVTL